MAQIINTNIASLNAQRNLTTSQGSLANSLQRLSSGLRINSAKDDAAGLGISSRMTSQINGLNQAARNANDGISLAQTAEGALSEISNNLQRIRQLAVQSANATNSATDRAALDAEAQQRIAEITRVGAQTQFNGLSLLDGTFTNQKFQIGAFANQTIDISRIADSRSTALGSNTLSGVGTIVGANGVGALKAAAATAGTNGVGAETDLTVSTVNGGTSAAIAYAANADAKAIAAVINAQTSGIGVTAEATNTATLSGISVAGTVSFTLNGAAVSAVVTDTNDLTSVMSSINASQASTGVTATFTDPATKSGLTLTTSDGRDIVIEGYANTGNAGATMVVGDGRSTPATVTLTNGGNNSTIKSGVVTLESTKGAITLAAANTDAFTSATQASVFSSVAGLSLASAAGSQSALDVIDAALAQVNSSRSDLGAIQNRFESTIANLQTASENLSASRSRIQDADFAAETANLSRAQILQQAGTAMLAQANALPQNVLSLLRG